MNLIAAENLAKQLMNEHGLLYWGFVWSNAKRVFGTCNSTHRVIKLSKPLTLLNDEIQVTDTILHEIAHGLVGAGQGHNYKWKNKCIEIGCKPIRCFSSKEVNMPTGKYIAVCAACDTSYTKHKKPKECKRSCRCQQGRSWDTRVLLTFVETNVRLVA